MPTRFDQCNIECRKNQWCKGVITKRKTMVNIDPETTPTLVNNGHK